jgi:hypothetical protein
VSEKVETPLEEKAPLKVLAVIVEELAVIFAALIVTV